MRVSLYRDVENVSWEIPSAVELALTRDSLLSSLETSLSSWRKEESSWKRRQRWLAPLAKSNSNCEEMILGGMWDVAVCLVSWRPTVLEDGYGGRCLTVRVRRVEGSLVLNVIIYLRWEMKTLLKRSLRAWLCSRNWSVLILRTATSISGMSWASTALFPIASRSFSPHFLLI